MNYNLRKSTTMNTSMPVAPNKRAPRLKKEQLSDSDDEEWNASKAKNPSGRQGRSQWSNEADDLLRHLVTIAVQFHKGALDDAQTWKDIAKKLGKGRDAKQCRERWYNHLRPGIKKGDWTRDEEKLINEMHDSFGPKWSTMSKCLSNRSENDIKNKWYSMQRKQKRLMEKIKDEYDVAKPPAVLKQAPEEHATADV